MRRGVNVSYIVGRALSPWRYAGGGRLVKIDFRVPFSRSPTRTKPPRELFSQGLKGIFSKVFDSKSLKKFPGKNFQ
jgi:hypothetical protein